MDLLKELNEKQKEALLKVNGPVLIIAGAGSGKTKVLTSKIAYILEEGYCMPWEILAITFTNKAANEMKERVEELVGVDSNDIWIGTFHKICMRILRKNISYVGYDSNFVIYDTTDQRSVVEEVMNEMEISPKEFDKRAFASAISNNKNNLITPEMALEKAVGKREEIYANVYKNYQLRLKRNNALDFDDIINLTIKLLKENKDVLEYYQEKFKYVFVDEYQDTNKAQFLLIKMITEKHRNVTVVGDNDQGIYSFRGADISNILDFEKDYKDAQVVYLEQNYRSTKNILNLANEIINSEKFGAKSKFEKNLWTDNTSGDIPKHRIVQTGYDEANYISQTIRDLKISNGYSNSDFAILYRINALSRVIESTLTRDRIPSQVIGGQKFFEREEIKDALAYLKVIDNPKDDVAFRRIINKPARGIGQKALDDIKNVSDQSGLSMYEALKNATEYGLEKHYAKAAIGGFFPVMTNAEKLKDDENVKISEILQMVLEQSGYLQKLEEDKSDKSLSRLKNLEELMDSIIEYETEEADVSLRNYLESVSLATDTDKLDEEDGKVTLMTLHSSKGLEYPVVFMIGMEEGTFPSDTSIKEGNLDEEQRLCYVGMTRAKEKLFLTSVISRKLYNRTQQSIPSRFVENASEKFLEKTEDDNIFGNIFGNIYGNNEGEFLYRKPKRQTVFNLEELETQKKPKDLNIKDFMRSIDVKNKEVDISKYKIGTKVMHKKFGIGKIVSIEPEANDNIITIEFENIGIKKLMLKYANLEIVEE